MSVIDAQRSLNKRFTYRSDAGENWQILKGDGPVSGDCEDYSLTLIWLAEGKSTVRFWLALLTFKYVLWHCKSPGGAGHAIVWVRRHGWTDNIQRRFVSRDDLRTLGYKLRFPYLAPLVLLKFALRPLLRRRKA